jgi:hypothetical protein
MPDLTIPYCYEPRSYHRRIYAAWQRGVRHLCLVMHRRSGKTESLVSILPQAMLQRKANYAHVFPTVKQSREVVWDGISRSGMRFIEHFPAPLLYGPPNKQELKVTLLDPHAAGVAGSTYQLKGTDYNVNALVGGGTVGVIWDEYSLQNPLARDYARPIMAENDGWEIVVYTPRGENHGYDLFQFARQQADWHVEYLTVEDTRRDGPGEDGSPVITAQAIEAHRRELLARGVDDADAVIDQEYYLSWHTPMPGAYYGKELRKLDSEGRICAVPYDPSLPTYTAWDLGHNDLNAIWFFQPTASEVRFIDYIQDASLALAPEPGQPWSLHPEQHWIGRVRSKPYQYDHSRLTPPLTRDPYEVHYAPHDMNVTEYSSGKARYGMALAAGLRFTVLERGPREDGIAAARQLLRRAVFDADRCKLGLSALRSYRREWDDQTQSYSNVPVHDWASNGCVVGDTEVETRAGRVPIAQIAMGDEVWTPNGYSRVEWAGQTKIAHTLIQITLSDGTTLYTTPEHKIFTELGLVYADALRYDYILCMGQEDICTHATSFSRASGLGFRESITCIRQRCIAPSGKLITDLCQKVATSIIRMGTTLTTTSTILSACLQPSIPGITPIIPIHGYGANATRSTSGGKHPLADGLGAKPTRLNCALITRKQRSGMPPQRGDSTLATLRSVHGASAPGWKSSARNADSLTRPLGRSAQGTATTIVGLRRLENVAVPVYDLTVEHNHCYLANGVLVSNSGAFRYAAVGLMPAPVALTPPIPGGSFAWARQNVRRAKLGLPVHSFRVGGQA